MIKHVVLYKFKDTISQDTINDIIETFNNCKSSLKKHLDHGFNYGLFMTFENTEVVKRYNELEDHKKAQAIMQEYQEDLLVFDIEC